MKIGIIGAGNMGQALGVRFAQLGHIVLFGARRIEQAEQAAALAGHGAMAGSPVAAATFGEVVIWTLRETDVASVIGEPALLDGKIVVDLNNRDYAQDASQGRTFGEAIAESLQAAAPGARVVKAFNTIAMEAFGNSPHELREAGAQTFLAGADQSAKAAIASLAAELGFAAIDAGNDAPALRAVEALGDVIRLLMMGAGHGGLAHLRLIQLPVPVAGLIGARQASNYR
jgi:8-hydroxy-5-deazaflavin:NADPH oxidoreductase